MSQIWYPSSQICLPSAQETTTFSPLSTLRHTVDTFEGRINSRGSSEWDKRDRFIYKEVEKRESEVLHGSKSWTKHTEQGRMILIVPQSLSFQCLLQLAPAIFTSPALMSFIHMVLKGNGGDRRTVWAAELKDLWWREREREWETWVLSAPKSRSMANQHLTQKFLCDWKGGLLMFTWVWKYARIFGGR